MKTVLVILTQPNLNSLQVHESLSAIMVLAAFGNEVRVLLQDAALSLLKPGLPFDPVQQAFKVASNLVDSFEFYDLTPILIENKHRNDSFVLKSQQPLEFVDFNSGLIQSFDHVLYW
ncbi:hypothetical protein [Acinetobacter sp. WZC-1]|uniref:hypothetical protein n=1 Tax=Acinetobacter sp. WZC-1 TaxID=3459034 RepID=UPI00403D8714